MASVRRPSPPTPASPSSSTKSYRTRDPLRVTGEVTDRQGHCAEQLKAMKDHIENLRKLDVEAIEG